MPIDPSIALGVKPIQLENPLDQAAKGLSVQHMIQQSQLGAEQLKATKMANAKQELAVRDQELARQAWKEFPGDPDAMLKRAAELGVGPESLTALQQHFTNVRKTNSEIADKDLTVKKYQNEQLAGLTSKALQMPDDQYAQAWPQMRQAALQINPKLQLPEQPLSKDDLDHFRLVFTTQGSLDAEEEEKRKTAGEVRAQAGEQRASMMAGPQLARATAEADTAGLQNAAQQLGAASDRATYARVFGSLPAQMAVRFPNPGVFDPNTTPAQVRQIGMNPEQQTQAVQSAAAAGEAARHNTATEKNASALLSVSQGRLGLEKQHADIAQHIYDQTYGEGANPALVGVLPAQRNAALSNAQKAADEYTKGAESLSNVQTFIDLAKKGNKAAGSNLPMMGAESIQALNGIRRINRTEIEQYQGAGSLLDKIQGRIGKLTLGQPIPKDVMDDIEALHKTIGENAAKNYNTKLDGINQNFHSNFKPIPGPKIGGAGVPDEVKNLLKEAGPGIHTVSDGGKWMTAADGTITKQ